MRQVTEKLIVRYRLILILVPVVLSAGACLVVRSLRVETRLEEFIPHQHPFAAIHCRLEQLFGGLNQVSILIRAKSGTIFRSEILERVYAATERLYQIDGVNIASIEGIAARKTRKVAPGENGFTIRRLMPRPVLSPDDIQELQQYVRGNPLLEGVLVSKDLSATLIQADFFPGVASQTVFTAVRSLAEGIAHPDIEVFYAGKPVLEGWLDHYLPQMGFLFIGSVLLLCTFLYASFRNIRAVLIPLCAAALAALWGLAGIALLGYTLTPSTVLVPFLVFALGICHSVQFMKRYGDLAPGSKDPVEVAQSVFNTLAQPATVSLITDAVGFASLALIPLGLLQKMALAAVIGIASLFYSVILFIPALLSYLPLPLFSPQEATQHPSPLDRFLPMLALQIVERRRTIITLFLLFFLVGIAGILRLSISGDQYGASPLYPDSHYSRSEQLINSLFGGAHSLYILVEGAMDEALVSAEVLRDMESLQDALRAAVPEIGGSRSLVDYIKGFHMIFNGFEPAFFRIPERDATIGEYLFLYSIAGYPGDFDFLVDRKLRHATIKIDLRDASPVTVSRLIRAADKWVATSQTSHRVRYLFPGGTVGLQAAAHETIQRQVPFTIAAVGLMLFLCATAFMRSINRALVLMLPLLLSVAVTFGIMGYMGIPLTIETMPLASLGMGLGIDAGIYIAAYLARAAATPQAVVHSLATTGKAVVFGALAVSLAVLLWIFSPVCMEAKLGKCLSLLLFINMLSALFFLPALYAENDSKDQ